MTAPMRIQRRRTKGWRMPPNTVSVTRPSKWGNRWSVELYRAAGYLGTRLYAKLVCVGAYRAWLRREPHWGHGGDVPEPPDATELRGRNLACFCKLCDAHKDGKPFGVQCDQCEPCHADVLLELANR